MSINDTTPPAPERPEARHLGHRSPLPDRYDPTLLVRVERQLARKANRVDTSSSPFEGFDVWHAYEVACMQQAGLPIEGILKVIYPASSPYIVESKSLKLYLHSLNNIAMGFTRPACIAQLVSTVQQDLRLLLNTDVRCQFFDHYTAPCDFEGWQPYETATPTSAAQENALDHELHFHTRLLRSRCRVTGQPDWGNLYVHMQGERLPHPQELLQQVVALRNGFHFHEEICELLYSALYQKYLPALLTVCTLYTRRGGIDINPCRTNNLNDLPQGLTDLNALTHPSWRQ